MRLTLAGDCGIDRYVDEGVERPGGCTLNVAAHLRQLAPKTWDIDVVSAIGTDASAALVRGALTKYGYGRFVRTMHGETARQSIKLQSDGEKLFCGYEAGVLGEFLPDAEQVARLSASDVVVTVAYEQVVRLVEALVGASRRVRLVMDFMNMQDFGGDLANVGGWLDGVHVASFGLRPDDTRLIRQIESWQRGARDRVAVVTLGASGSLVLAGDASTPIPAVPVAKVVDTTGAGDAYLAAFLSRYLNGETPADAARFAARHASGVVQTLGAF